MLIRLGFAAAAALLIAGVALVMAGSAWGSTTVGQLFVPIDGCAANTVYVQTSVPSGNGYTIPTDGVVTKWSFQLGNAAISGLRFEVASPSSGGSRTIVGQAVAGSQTPGAINTYPAQIVVAAGDVIGIFFGGGGNCFLGSGMGETIDYDMADLAVGDSGMFSQLTGNKLPVEATVEPDADRDGYGDETQDQCPNDPATHGPCPPPASPPAAPKDTTPPLVSAFGRRAKLSRRGTIGFFLRSNEAAKGAVAGTVALPKSARVVRFNKRTITLRAGVRTKVSLRLTRKQATVVRRILKRHSLTAKIAVALKDTAGNATTKKLSLKLHG